MGMYTSRSCSRALQKALKASAGVALWTFVLGISPVHAASYTWDGFPGGSGPNNNSKWTNPNNWGVPDAANIAPPASDATGLTNSDIFFAGALKTTPRMEDFYSIRTLTFNNDAAPFTLESQTPAQTLTIGSGGIINQSVNLQTINSALVLGDAQTWNASSGGLQIGGSVALGNYSLTVGGSFDTTIAGTIGGSGGLAKTGTGILSLTTGNSFAGGTIVSDGTLAVNNTLGSATGTSDVTVSPGAILTGAGIITGPVTVNGTLSPGDSLGNLTINNNLTLGPGSSTLVELGGIGAGQYDRVTGVGELALGGVITVSLVNGFNPVPGDRVDLFDCSLIDSSNFDLNTDLILPTLMNGWIWDRSQFLFNGQIAIAIPEPPTVPCIGIGLLVLLCFSARRKF
jgi:autotransporter-associated beta strand protein